MLYALIAVLGSLWLLAGNVFASNTPNDPVYVVDGDRWIGLFGDKNEYAEFSFPRNMEVKIEDAYHILMKQGRLGIMVTFAAKKEFGAGADLLANHARWEIECWRSQADRVESATRSDLSGARRDLKVTEVRLFKNSGERNDRFPDWA